MKKITVAVCTYNRAHCLPRIVNSLRHQECSIPFEILVVNNNSIDNTEEELRELSQLDGVPLRFVKEKMQGIVYARNRAIEESRDSAYLAFIDDDELPGPNWLKAAIDALDREGAKCVGGEIRVPLSVAKRPGWLEEELFPFLGEVKNASGPFWITDRSTPVWSGNVAYKTSIFSDGLRFDHRYNRLGHAIGGGEDELMFNTLLDRGVRMRYRPDMLIEHLVEKWRLKKRYFLKLHYKNGWKRSRWGEEEYDRSVCGVPSFMVIQALQQWGKTLSVFIFRRPGALRQAMNATHAIGIIIGRFQRWKDGGRRRTQKSQ